MVIQTPDKTRIGLATCKPCLVSESGSNEFTVKIDLNWLAPGSYIISLVLYSVNDFGTEKVHDRVTKACVFEKTLNDGTINNMSWNTTWWGHVMIPEPEIVE